MAVLSDANAYQYGSMHGGGAVRWSAHELFDPEEFGLNSTRPTAACDIYAFACICIEVRPRPDSPWLKTDDEVLAVHR